MLSAKAFIGQSSAHCIAVANRWTRAAVRFITIKLRNQFGPVASSLTRAAKNDGYLNRLILPLMIGRPSIGRHQINTIEKVRSVWLAAIKQAGVVYHTLW